LRPSIGPCASVVLCTACFHGHTHTAGRQAGRQEIRTNHAGRQAGRRLFNCSSLTHSPTPTSNDIMMQSTTTNGRAVSPVDRQTDRHGHRRSAIAIIAINQPRRTSAHAHAVRTCSAGHIVHGCRHPASVRKAAEQTNRQTATHTMTDRQTDGGLIDGRAGWHSSYRGTCVCRQAGRQAHSHYIVHSRGAGCAHGSLCSIRPSIHPASLPWMSLCS